MFFILLQEDTEKKQAKILAETLRIIPILNLIFKIWQLNPYIFS